MASTVVEFAAMRISVYQMSLFCDGGYRSTVRFRFEFSVSSKCSLLKSCIKSLNPYHIWQVRHNAMASQITDVPSVYSTVCSDVDQWKHQSSALLTFVCCVGNSPVTGGFPHKGPVARKMYPFDDVIMLVWCVTLPRQGQHFNPMLRLVSIGLVNNKYLKTQGSFWVWAQPIMDDVTMWRRLSYSKRSLTHYDFIVVSKNFGKICIKENLPYS